jgi:hypothetical protein
VRPFNVGQVVTYVPDVVHRDAAPGDYKVVAAMPDRDGDHMYRIKSLPTLMIRPTDPLASTS